MAKIDRLTKQSKEHLDTDEEIVATVLGSYEGEGLLETDIFRAGIFIATDKRVILYGKKMFGYELEVFPYSSISSIEISKGTRGHDVSFFASNNKMRMRWISTGDIQKFTEYVKSKIEKTNREHTQSESTVDVADQIRKLAELKDEGILTEDEFESKKNQLLDKL